MGEALTRGSAPRTRVHGGRWDEAQHFSAPDGTIIVAVPRSEGPRGVLEVHCHGPNAHFRDPDGGCEHTDYILHSQSGRYMPIRVLGYRAYGSRRAMEAGSDG